MKLIHISVAMSLDGFIDDSSPNRLVLSSPEDLGEMESDRSECDAILVGANTVRLDNPSLLIKSRDLIEAREKRGQKSQITKVTVTRTGHLDRECQFFADDGATKLVICPKEFVDVVTERLGGPAKILPLPFVDAGSIVSALEAEGIQSLFVEGGTQVLTMFLSQGLFHRMRLALAPFFIGDAFAPRFVSDAAFKHGKDSRLRIVGTRLLGDTAVLDIENQAGIDV